MLSGAAVLSKFVKKPALVAYAEEWFKIGLATWCSQVANFVDTMIGLLQSSFPYHMPKLIHSFAIEFAIIKY